MNAKEIEFIKSISNDFHNYRVCSSVADFIACQFALESNFGRSRVAIVKNNYSGMKCPMLRHTFDLEQKPNVFARYSSLMECEIDYLLWVCYNRIKKFDLSNVERFAIALRTNGYCPDDDYIERIQSIYKQFKNSTK